MLIRSSPRTRETSFGILCALTAARIRRESDRSRQTLRVQDRVENIVLEATTKQRKIKDTVLLEGATCDGICHRLCARQSFLFWRECWLEKVS